MLFRSLIDAYTIFAASVLAANGIIRSLFGAAFPLFTKQMYANLGIHWASSVPAFLALACLPFPFLFYKYGAAIRKKCKYAAQADAFMERIRGQMAARAQLEQEETSQPQPEASRPNSFTTEEEHEHDLDEKDEQPMFEKIKAHNDTDNGLQRVGTGRSSRSKRSVKVADEYDGNPYEIDRVNTRESFANRPRASSKASTFSRTHTQKF